MSAVQTPYFLLEAEVTDEVQDDDLLHAVDCGDDKVPQLWMKVVDKVLEHA